MTSALKGATAAASASASAAAAERGRAACSPITISDSGSGSMEGSRRVTRSASNAGKAAPAVAAVAASAAAASVASAAATEAERKFKAEDRRFSQLSQPPSVGALPGEEILAQVPPSLPPAARAKKKVRIVRTRSQVYAEFIKANNEAQRCLTLRERLYEEKEEFEKELAGMKLEISTAAEKIQYMHDTTIATKKEHTASANRLRLIMAADDVTMTDVDGADRLCSELRRKVGKLRERLLLEKRLKSGKTEKEKALNKRKREIDEALPEIDAELDKLMDRKNEALGRVIELEKELAAMEDIDDVRRTTDHYAAAAAAEKPRGTKPKHFAAAAAASVASASAARPAKRQRTGGGGGGGGGGGN